MISLLCLAGFGNLRGNMEFWNVDTHTLIGKAQASDSTLLEWSPNGVHVLTATTAPRLRVGNGFKLWNFDGDLLCNVPTLPNEELWDVSWCPSNYNFPPPDLTTVHKPAVTQTKPIEVKKEVYVPPSLRGRPCPVTKDESDTTKSDAPLSKSAAKNKRKREAQKRVKEERGEEQLDAIKTASYIMKPSTEGESSSKEGENDKRLKNLKKKLRQIESLKEQLSSGKALEANQMEKLKSEQSIIDEIAQLQL